MEAPPHNSWATALSLESVGSSRCVSPSCARQQLWVHGARLSAWYMGAIDEVASHRVGNTEYESRLCELDSVDVRNEGGDCTVVLRRTQAAGDDPRFAVHGVHRHLCALRLSRRMSNLLCDVQVSGNRNRRILRLFIYSCAGCIVSALVEGFGCILCTG